MQIADIFQLIVCLFVDQMVFLFLVFFIVVVVDDDLNIFHLISKSLKSNQFGLLCAVFFLHFASLRNVPSASRVLYKSYSVTSKSQTTIEQTVPICNTFAYILDADADRLSRLFCFSFSKFFVVFFCSAFIFIVIVNMLTCATLLNTVIWKIIASTLGFSVFFWLMIPSVAEIN